MARSSPKDLEMELEQATKLCQLKDEELQKCRDRVSSLRRELFQQSQSPNPDLAELSAHHFSNLERENSLLERENDELKRRYLTLLAQKNEYKSRYRKLKTVAVAPALSSPSGLQAENQALRQKVAELTHSLACAVEEKDFANEQLQERAETIKAMRAEATEKFEVLRKKLAEERVRNVDGDAASEIAALKARYEGEIETLRNRLREREEEWKSENTELLKTIDDLERSAQDATAAQIGFISSLEEMLGCSTFAEALGKVQELVKGRGGNQQGYADLVDALRQILANLSPNALELKPDSELRQLFAALCNVLTAAVDPLTNKALLMAHVRALVFQARVFSPKGDADQ
jgi:hypothetical protein